MNAHPELILFIGIIFFLGLVAEILANKISLPRVSLLIILGIFIGPSGLNLLPKVFIDEWFHTITTIALGMIGFLIGQQFTWSKLNKSGISVFSIALGKVLMSFVLISAMLLLIRLPLPAAVILASIASATAPAAIYEVVHEMKIRNKFVTTLLAVVAFDDILALFLFSLVLSVLSASEQIGWYMIVSTGMIEIFGSLLLGYMIGYPVAKITGRIKPGEPSMIEALGSVFFISGLSQWLGLSPILAAMAMGSAVTTFAKHHTSPFHAIENIQWVFMIIFFILAGAALEIDALFDVGFVGFIYIMSRLAGFYIGVRLGAKLSGSDINIEKWMGLALIPQAGVAIGMALIASQHYSEYTHLILPIVLGTTIIFEIFGPMVTRYALRKSDAMKKMST
ncbi:cation:proton antiporter [Sulfurovum sp.]|uniref:cation:proton antiporter n=1 Tax=Sulfurovum sp. TaxID=1969726 RepID=UPI003561939D